MNCFKQENDFFFYKTPLDCGRLRLEVERIMAEAPAARVEMTLGCL